MGLVAARNRPLQGGRGSEQETLVEGGVIWRGDQGLIMSWCQCWNKAGNGMVQNEIGLRREQQIFEKERDKGTKQTLTLKSGRGGTGAKTLLLRSLHFLYRGHQQITLTSYSQQ